MPRRREQVFVQVALRRAQALSLYAASGDLDAEVVFTWLRMAVAGDTKGRDVRRALCRTTARGGSATNAVHQTLNLFF
jgi:hypothetical protein